MALVLASAGVARAACQLRLVADFPLEDRPNRPLIKGAINGRPALLLADTGAWATSMSLSDARKFGASPDQLRGLDVYGVGGNVSAGSAHFDLELGRFPLKNEIVVVLGGKSIDDRASILIGRDILTQHDLELDLASHAIRLLKPEGCRPEQMVYWDKPYAQVRLEGQDSNRPEIRVNVILDGHVVPALVDSGAPFSLVSPEVEALSGAKAETSTKPEMVGGIGPGQTPAHIARFDSFSIGDETIHNVRIRVADMWKSVRVATTGTRLSSVHTEYDAPRMLLGADFLQAHRVLIAFSQGLMMYSYQGGPVFDVNTSTKPKDPASVGPS